jgi:LPLT family lysophospholipid transporter-like MFS transporter
MLTLVAIVGGLMGGAVLYDATLSVPVCYVAACALYAAALVLAATMERTPCNPAASLRHSTGQFFSSAGAILRRPRLAWIILGSALFWFAGATLRSALQGWGLLVFAQAGVAHVTNLKLVLLKLGLVAGIVLGSWLAGVRHRTSDLSWATRYALLLAVAVAGLGLMGGRFGIAPVVLVLVATGAAAGLLVVPFNAALQSETDPARLGKTISLQNCTDYVGIAAGAAFLSFLSRFSLTANQDLLVLGGAVAAIAGLLAVLSRGPAPQASGSQPGS